MFRDVGQSARKTCENYVPRCTSYINYDQANLNQVYIHAPITVELQARMQQDHCIYIPKNDNLKTYKL